tara:strand:+ start:27812 stop:28180 length:369 start_codon:yes stop_codon:yes gene_type:complete
MILQNVDEHGEETYELVELYNAEENGNYNSYCSARICSPDELQQAATDIAKDGINTSFYNENKELNKGKQKYSLEIKRRNTPEFWVKLEDDSGSTLKYIAEFITEQDAKLYTKVMNIYDVDI